MRGISTSTISPSNVGGSDEIANLAVVCPHHHAQLVPQGEWIITGNPSRPDGLELLGVDEWRARLAARGDSGIRTGPSG